LGTNTLIICPLEQAYDNKNVVIEEASGLCHAL